MTDMLLTGTGRRLQRRDLVVATCVGLFAVMVRLAHLSDAGMWEDEAFRFDVARGDQVHFVAGHAQNLEVFRHDPAHTLRVAPLKETLKLLRDSSPYPPAFFVLMHGLMHLGVTSVSWLLLVNALAGGVVAMCLYRLARRGLSVGGALVAACFSALSPWDIGVSMQFKEIGLATALCVASTAVFFAAIDSGKWRWWLLSGALLGLAVNTHQQAVFWGVLQVALLLSAPRDWRRVIPRAVAGWSLGALLFVPWLVYAGGHQFDHLQAVSRGFAAKEGSAWTGVVDQLAQNLGWSLAPLGPMILRAAPILFSLLFVVLSATVWSVFKIRRVPAVTGAPVVVALGGLIWVGSLLMATLLYPSMKQSLIARYAPLYLPGAWLAVAGLFELGAQFVLGERASSVTAQATRVVGALGFMLVLLPKPWASIPLDRYADWRGFSETMRDRVADDDLVVHLPGAGAFDAFVHQWPRATRHVVVGDVSRDVIARVAELAAPHRLWLVFAWGRSSERGLWLAELASAGWVEIPPSVDPYKPTIQRIDSIPYLARISTGGVEALGFQRIAAESTPGQ